MKHYFRQQLKVWLMLTLAFSAAANSSAADLLRVLDSKTYRLGTPDAPEWFDSPRPDAQQIEIHFNAERNEHPWTLFLRQAGVKFAWPVLLNGRKLGALTTTYQPLVHTLTIPPGALRNGMNTLSIPPMPGGDDVEVGEFKLAPFPPNEVLRAANLEVMVTDADGGGELPCRITIADESGALAALQPEDGQQLAVRAGRHLHA